MKLTTLLLLLVTGTLAYAGEVYGRITIGSQGVGPGVSVEIRVPPNGSKVITKTDRSGSYRVFVRAKGKGTITAQPTIQGRKVSAKGTVVSYDKPACYNFQVVQEPRTKKYILRRK